MPLSLFCQFFYIILLAAVAGSGLLGIKFKLSRDVFFLVIFVTIVIVGGLGGFVILVFY